MMRPSFDERAERITETVDAVGKIDALPSAKLSIDNTRSQKTKTE